MPMKLIVHAKDCPTMKSPCSCAKQEFTNGQAAIDAHEGDHRRLELVSVTTPFVPIPAWKSQARRHQAISD